ncbi:MAG TPA: prepilin-type N-terminal cleavage/methylation domain-containing protein [Candidatus Saccharimonadales bacterium]|jgi:type II secretion system protein G|nr:prepilin-type N-terminal cleavage/methylation domain-containing protein [Candidatus Saccharimonadales bacterium]
MLKIKNNHRLNNFGFTLVELLVVITILGILATVGLVAFTSAQTRGRDTERKSDLKQLSNALELYFSDHGSYPSSSGGLIMGCPSTVPSICSWGTSEFTDNKTLYFKTLPKDPVSDEQYYYRTVIVDSVANQGFQLYARLENSQDPSCINGNCGTHVDLPTNVNCGSSGSCNFAVTSANVTAIQQ